METENQNGLEKFVGESSPAVINSSDWVHPPAQETPTQSIAGGWEGLLCQGCSYVGLVPLTFT